MMKRFAAPTIVLSLFFFLLPWQTRYIFGAFTISGETSEFGVMSIYATELLLVIGLAIVYGLEGFPAFTKKDRALILPGLLLFVVAGAGMAAAVEPVLAAASLLHLGMALLVYIVLLDKRVKKEEVMRAFGLGLVFPVLLAIYQVITGGSGASSILGLAPRDAGRLGESVVMFGGERALRAYGSFSHPNVFGGFLAVGLASVLANWKRVPRGFELGISALFGLGLVLTLSRSALFGAVLGMVVGGVLLLIKPLATARKVAFGIIFGALVFTFASLFLFPDMLAGIRGGGRLEDQSINDRLVQYTEFAQVMQGESWILGHGLSNYVLAVADRLPGRPAWEYEPVHNTLLLLLAESGILGLLAVLLFLSRVFKAHLGHLPDPNAVAAFAMAATLIFPFFFDHYLWSSWSGLALAAYVLAMLARLGEEPAEAV